jgi:hypothetical protein
MKIIFIVHPFFQIFHLRTNLTTNRCMKSKKRKRTLLRNYSHVFHNCLVREVVLILAIVN